MSLPVSLLTACREQGAVRNDCRRLQDNELKWLHGLCFPAHPYFTLPMKPGRLQQPGGRQFVTFPIVPAILIIAPAPSGFADGHSPGGHLSAEGRVQRQKELLRLVDPHALDPLSVPKTRTVIGVIDFRGAV